ncbi:hypothetical protein H4219_003084 [Mycoemilia scoparia]|uniref:RPA43 OB domain-containing protein n=1 Tax=Mycoemilia scoparia TaxID=417184 RepID=A0A9W8DPS3_9FUNG|nr:hypothetical protein H4219_003084 [Mycoemilia scoparia]
MGTKRKLSSSQTPTSPTAIDTPKRIKHAASKADSGSSTPIKKSKKKEQEKKQNYKSSEFIDSDDDKDIVETTTTTATRNIDKAATEEKRAKKEKKSKDKKKSKGNVIDVPGTPGDSSKSSKKDKKDKKEKKKKSQSSSKGLENGIQALVSSASKHTGSGFVETTSQVLITLSPAHANDPWAGIHDTLNSMILCYVAQLEGVVLCYNEVTMSNDLGLMLFDSPYSQFKVQAKFLLWKPQVGMKMKGQITIQSPDHIGLLLFNTFNASIPSSLIQKSAYEWKKAADDEDQDKVPKVPDAEDVDQDEEEKDGMDVEEDVLSADKESKPTATGGSLGEWVKKNDGSPIDNENGWLEFSVVEVLRANEVLSITGCLA